MSTILWILGVLWFLGTIAVIYGIMTAEENNDPEEWDGK